MAVTLGSATTPPCCNPNLTSTGHAPPIPWWQGAHFPDHYLPCRSRLSRASPVAVSDLGAMGARTSEVFTPGPDPACCR